MGDPLAEQTQSFVEKNLKWNFTVNVLDNLFYTLAISLISRETIMPLLVSRLTDWPVAIGLIPAIYSLSSLLPQLFIANYSERLNRKLPFVLLGGVLQRVPYLLIGFALLAFAVHAPVLALILFFAGIATAAFGGGIVTPAWFTMVGNIIPMRRRGIFFGLADGGGLLMGVIGAFFVGKILDLVSYPESFSLLFLGAAGLTAISWIALALTREKDSIAVRAAIPLRRYFKQLPAILRAHHNYRRFLISYALLQLSMMAVSFYIVFGDSAYELSGAEIGLLNAIFIGTQALMRLVFGWLGDRWGHKRNLALAAGGLALAAAVALSSSDFSGLLVAYICLACALASDSVSNLNIVLEFAPEEARPTFIGLTNTILAPVTFVGPVFGGWIAGQFGIEWLFGVSLILGVIAAAMLALFVREPRHFAKTQAAA